MKHLSTMLLAVGLSGFCAMAQNVTVVMKDGTSHKFNADHLSEIKFRDVAPDTPPVEFSTLTVDPYSNGNVSLKFTIKDGEKVTEAITDLYGPADATWLHAGTYTLNAANDPYTIDPVYTSLKVENQDKKITDAKLIVTEADRVYSFDLEMTLEDGSRFRGNYSGELDTYVPWIDVVLSAASYNSNPQRKGDFYVKMNDADWKYEMAFVFTADAEAKELPAGTYTYSEARIPGTISPASYVDTYNPNANLKLAEGSKIIVTKDGDNYTMEMTLNLSDGRTADMHYAGKITGTPTFEEPEVVMMDTVEEDVYGGGNVELTFSNENETIVLDMYGSGTAVSLEPGTYTVVSGDIEGFHIDSGYSGYSANNNTVNILSGSVSVAEAEGVYTIDIDIMVEGENEGDAARSIVRRFVGKLPKYGTTIERTMTGAEYNDYDSEPGRIKVKFKDNDWNSVLINAFVPADAKTLPAGTYTYGDNGAEFTFDRQSYAEIAIGYGDSNFRFAEGSTITVTEAEGVYDITMELIFTTGKKATIKYNGTISGDPFPQQ